MTSREGLFTSPREQRFWLLAFAVVAAIYSTLGLAGTLAEELRREGRLEAAFFVGFVLMLGVVVASALRRRPGKRELWVLLAVLVAYGMIVVRSGIEPEERTHLFEYGLVALLIDGALSERRRNGGRVPTPALLTVLLTALLGWLDEGVQAILPSRVYDLRDVAFNALAGVLAIGASRALAGARRWDLGRRGRDRP